MQKKKVRKIAFKTMQKTLKNDSKTEQESTLHRRAKKTSKIAKKTYKTVQNRVQEA